LVSKIREISQGKLAAAGSGSIAMDAVDTAVPASTGVHGAGMIGARFNVHALALALHTIDAAHIIQALTSCMARSMTRQNS
jgi:hypothetical protein